MKKETVTSVQIKKDILDSYKFSKEMSKSDYKKTTVFAVIGGIAMFVLEWVYLKAILWVLLGIFAVAVLSVCCTLVRRYYKKKKFCMDDYEITTEVLEHKAEEHYIDRHSRYGRGLSAHRSRPVNLYDLYFENGKSWRILDTNYAWSAEYVLSGNYIYENAHRGDEFIVVSKKATGEIAMVYPTSLFVYRESAE